MKKKISILGSTGSIGVSSLDVIEQHPDRFEIVALAAGSNVQLLAEQIEKFQPQVVSVKDEAKAKELKPLLKERVEILHGAEGAVAVATHSDAEMVLSSIVGAVGLAPTYEAIKAGKTIGLANKETLVAAGSLMMDAARKNNVSILPVDSEHSAIFQSLEGHRKEDVFKIILTASGGPFWNYKGDFKDITLEMALKHPNWSMGSKITIDSATMMNKGLEVIEACWLFDTPENEIEVLVHPQSIIHSMVEYKDGSVVAQMARPDMRGPISYALSYPERITNNIPFVDWVKQGTLSFFEPNNKKFPLLGTAREAIRTGGSMPAVMNAANEIAVAAFLENKIKFTDIHRVVTEVMSSHSVCKPASIEEVLDVDREGRRLAEEKI